VADWEDGNPGRRGSHKTTLLSLRAMGGRKALPKLLKGKGKSSPLGGRRGGDPFRHQKKKKNPTEVNISTIHYKVWRGGKF